MRETLRHLASIGKTVLVSSHLLAEVQQMADVVGIIAAGRLVREGPMHQLLNAEGIVRVRVGLDEVAAGMAVLVPLAGSGAVTSSVAEPGWLSVRVAPDRTGEVNRALAEAGIWATGLETGNDLEMLFLELTGGAPAPGGEGTFFGMAGSRPDPGSSGDPGTPGSTGTGAVA
jgi:ABC-2 type transport system ATP-binding protein